MWRQMQTETSTTKSSAHRTAMPAFAPVLRPPAGGCGAGVDDGVDIIVVGVRERRDREVVGRRLSACALSVGAEFAADDAGRIRGVRTRVVVISVLAIRESACATTENDRL
jgi:hypothetical protein